MRNKERVMNMKKAFQKYAIIWAIFFVVFNVICFVTPGEAAGMNKFGGAFWAGSSFTVGGFCAESDAAKPAKMAYVRNFFIVLSAF